MLGKSEIERKLRIVSDSSVAIPTHAEKISLVKYRPALTSPNKFMNIHTFLTDVRHNLVMLGENWARFTKRAFP